MKKKYKVILIIVGVLIVIRLILPSVVLHYANRALANMNGYYGHIDDIDLSLWRGGYTVNNVYLNKVDSVTNEQTEFFQASSVDFSMDWVSLFQGSLVGEMVFESPKLTFENDATELGDLANDSTAFAKLLNDFMPMLVNEIKVNNGTLHYIDSTTKPVVDVSLTNLSVIALNLTNIVDADVELPATIKGHGAIYEGTIDFSMTLNAMSSDATFDMNAELKNTNLVSMNDFFKAYGKFDVSSGHFGLYTEMAAKDGNFIGYVKPIIKDLKVIGAEDRNDSFISKLWESVIGIGGVVLENKKHDQVASKVEMKGTFENPEIKKLDAFWELLRNAFIHALIPSIDNEISINSVKSAKNKPSENKKTRIFSTRKKFRTKNN